MPAFPKCQMLVGANNCFQCLVWLLSVELLKGLEFTGVEERHLLFESGVEAPQTFKRKIKIQENSGNCFLE